MIFGKNLLLRSAEGFSVRGLKKGKLVITRISSIPVLDTAILAYHVVQTMAASYYSPKGKAQAEMV